MFSAAIAAPFDSFEQQCKPKSAGSHDCLDPMPAYSYHLGVRSNYKGDLCLNLGAWEGENKVVVEWDGLQTELQLTGKSGVQHYLQPEQRDGRSSAIVIYSNQLILPQIVAQGCGPKRELNQVTVVAWPQGEADASSVAQLPQASLAQQQSLGQDSRL